MTTAARKLDPAPDERWRPPDLWWARSRDGVLGLEVMFHDGRLLCLTFDWPPSWYWTRLKPDGDRP
jgi:hypothetical protein